MKKITVLLVAMLFVFGAFAQKINDKDVPKGIMDDFNNKYPTAEKVMWSKIDKRTVAEFKHDGDNARAEYENNYWQCVYWSVPEDACPYKIKEYIKEYYKGLVIIKTDILQTNTNENSYVITIGKKKKKATTELYFETTGSFKKKVDLTPEVKK